MKKHLSRIGFTGLYTLGFSAFVLALASSTAVSAFESEFIKSLKEKFKAFSSQSRQERVYVQTDKTFYNPGETIWFTAYVREAETLKPSGNSDIIHIEFISPKGTTEKHIKIVAKNGAAQGDFDLSEHPGGIYKIKAYTEWQKNEDSSFSFEKDISVQNVVMPRLKMKLDFEKKAYGRGDEVTAKLELNTNANKPLANTTVKFKANLDGKELSDNTATTDADGKVNLKFSLPKDLNTVDGTVNAMIDFEGTTESVSRSIPIVLNKIAMEFFPEGGDMVNGMNAKVAFKASNEFGKPADVEGIIVDGKGAFVAHFSSYHFGMGAVDFVPKANESYKARIIKPAQILDEFDLPEALPVGYVLNLDEKKSGLLQLEVSSWQNEELSLVAQTRGKIYYAGAFKAAKGGNKVVINTKDFPIGISQITLFDSKGIERCERLAFVNKEKQLKISVTTDKQQYRPREKVAMNIKVTDENGLPMPGNFSLAVADDNLLSFADDKQGNILSKILLEPDLKEKVEEPNFYFDAKEPKADKALDLLMMTSGWRHYTWKQVVNGSFPHVLYAAEKAAVGGIVYDGYTGKPVAAAHLKFNGSDKNTETDKDGKFNFVQIDITKSNLLEISAPGHSTQTQTIYGYSENNNIYLYDRRNYGQRVIKEEMDMPVAVAQAAPVHAPAYQVDGVKAGGRGAKQDFKVPLIDPNNASGQNAVTAERMAPTASRKADLAPSIHEDITDMLPDQTLGLHKIQDAPITNANIGDLRSAGFAKYEPKQNNQAAFYRAKEFAQKKYSPADTSRNNFGTTVYWNGNIETDRNGKAKVEFITNDLISSFKTSIEGFGDDGSIGRAEYKFSTGLPFSMDAKIPTELVSGDKVMIPVFFKNTTTATIEGKLEITAPVQLQLVSKQDKIILEANSTKVIYIECSATEHIGEGNIEVKFASEKINDAITRKLSVIAKGFPAIISLSGQEMQKEFAINPVNVVPGSMKVSFVAYPNIMGELMSGAESILREPGGCFEQTSSSNYPNIMALEYLKTMKVNNPELEAKAKNLLDRGYKRLTSFETKENGYEWFGASPPHEALTAYGLMEFEDMKQVYNGVDQKMVDRTLNLLLERRDGYGGFKKNPKAIDGFGRADEDITNAYIVYALSEAGYKDMGKELKAVYKSAKESNDPYVMALCANSFYNVGDKTKGDEMVSELISARNEAGFWTGKKHSITRSSGEGLKVETTSLILIALMKAQNPDVAAITSAVKFLVGTRSGSGGFGSTQATILALKALTKYAEFSKKTDEAGTVEILVNGAAVASKDYAKGERDNVIIGGLDKFIQAGKQQIEVRYKGCRQALPYAMNVSYSTILPESSKSCVVGLDAKLSARQVKVGETVRLSATLKNRTAEGQPMTMAIIGIPAGFSAQPWQLKEMQEKGVIDFYEIIGNNIACYYRSLAPNAQKQINFDLKAEIPGEYDAPASSAYLYYTNEHKDWVGLEKIRVEKE